MSKNNVFDDLYEIRPATMDDLDEICTIFCDSLEKDTLSIALNSNLARSEHLSHVHDMQKRKFANPLYIWFKAVEKASSATVGWACMRLAGPAPERTTSGAQPEPGIDGINEKVWHYLTTVLGPAMAAEEGYNPSKHLMRAGLHVLPNHQRQGIASHLSHALNEIADKENRATFVRARPVAAKFFEQDGWAKISEKHIPYRELGLDLDPDGLTVLRREPRTLK